MKNFSNLLNLAPLFGLKHSFGTQVVYQYFVTDTREECPEKLSSKKIVGKYDVTCGGWYLHIGPDIFTNWT